MDIFSLMFAACFADKLRGWKHPDGPLADVLADPVLERGPHHNSGKFSHYHYDPETGRSFYFYH